ncbi:MAG: tetratricopeptide repeat protein [Pseudomonadota bacterium]
MQITLYGQVSEQHERFLMVKVNNQYSQVIQKVYRARIFFIFCMLFVFTLTGCSKVTLIQRLAKDAQEAEKQETAFEEGNKDWSKDFIKSPKDPDIALHYAKSLIRNNEKNKAFQVLQTGLQYNPKNELLVSEYARLAIKLKKLELAEQSIHSIEAPTDWRLISAKGTLYAKNGAHKNAQKEFQKALKIKPDEPTVLNNLALSYALNGNPGKAESLLRNVIQKGQATDQIKQNLALVLSLQGRFKDAKALAVTTMPEVAAQDEINYFRKLVKKPVIVENSDVPSNIVQSASFELPQQKKRDDINIQSDKVPQTKQQ